MGKVVPVMFLHYKVTLLLETKSLSTAYTSDVGVLFWFLKRGQGGTLYIYYLEFLWKNILPPPPIYLLIQSFTYIMMNTHIFMLHFMLIFILLNCSNFGQWERLSGWLLHLLEMDSSFVVLSLSHFLIPQNAMGSSHIISASFFPDRFASLYWSVALRKQGLNNRCACCY